MTSFYRKKSKGRQVVTESDIRNKVDSAIQCGVYPASDTFKDIAKQIWQDEDREIHTSAMHCYGFKDIFWGRTIGESHNVNTLERYVYRHPTVFGETTNRHIIGDAVTTKDAGWLDKLGGRS